MNLAVYIQYELISQDFSYTFTAQTIQIPNPLRGELIAIILALYLALNNSLITLNTDSQQASNKILAYISNNHKIKKQINNHRAILTIIMEILIQKILKVNCTKISQMDDPNNH